MPEFSSSSFEQDRVNCEGQVTLGRGLGKGTFSLETEWHVSVYSTIYTEFYSVRFILSGQSELDSWCNKTDTRSLHLENLVVLEQRIGHMYTIVFY